MQFDSVHQCQCLSVPAKPSLVCFCSSSSTWLCNSRHMLHGPIALPPQGMQLLVQTCQAH